MKMIHRLASLSAALLFMQSSHVVLALETKTVAQQAAISVVGQGPFYRLNLPVTIYPTAAHVDLRDVRIRNASGNLVPHAWLHNEVAAPQIISGVVGFYPIAVRSNGGTNEQSDLSLEFKQNVDGSLLNIRTKTAQAKSVKSDSIIDVSQIKGSLLQARFEVDENAEGLFPLSIEASDDLRHWHTISGDEQIAVLKRQGAKIEKLSVDLYGNRAKFLRLRWRDAAPAITIKSITIDSVQQNEVLAPLQWSVAIKASNCSENYCDYLLPANTPIDSLRINLSEPNTLASITVSGQYPVHNTNGYQHRHHPLYVLRHKRQPPANATAAQVILAQTVSYRLTQSNGEARSENVVMDGGIYTHLRLQTQGPINMLGQVAPSIEVASTPRSLIFLGRGSAPFSLSWGVDEKQGDALALATLVPGYQPDKVVSVDAASVEIPLAVVNAIAVPVKNTELSEKEKSAKSDRKLWLWAALAGGLLLLAGMAWSLFKGLGKTVDETR
jgi:hypothetical protein